MTKDFELMQRLFVAGATGRSISVMPEGNMERVYSLSVSQGVWDVVFLGFMRLYETGKVKMKPENFEKLKSRFMSRVASETKRRAFNSRVFSELEKSSLEPCYLKGYSLSVLYDVPDSRVSGDTDIYIGEKNEEKAKEIVKGLGYEIKGRPGTSHHCECMHPVGGLLELHVLLYDELFEDVWFDNQIALCEAYREFTTQDGFVFKTLGYTDGLVFTVLHYIKHFLTMGAGVRQLMDCVLYVQKYKNEVNKEKFVSLMKHLKFDKFFDLCMSCAVFCWDFDEKELFFINECKNDTEAFTELFDDMEVGGVFGENDALRKDFYKVYNRERFKTFKKGDYDEYMNRWNRHNIMWVFFPSPKSLTIKYKYLEKSILLYPIAYVHRIIGFVIKVLKKEKSVKTSVSYVEPENNEILNKRMKFIKKMEML